MVALVVFVLVEMRVREPLIDMRLMRVRGVWATDLVALILGFAMFGTFVLVPTLLQLPEVTGFGFGKSVSSDRVHRDHLRHTWTATEVTPG